MNGSRKLFYAILAAILFLFVIIIAVVTMRKGTVAPQEDFNTVPYPTSVSNPSSSLPQRTNPPVLYEKTQGKKLLNKLKNRVPLSSEDASKRSSIITSLHNASGILQRTNNYTIKYIKTPDTFEVEILTENISLSKQEATQWFLSQGFSAEGLCNLPTLFFLSWEVSQKLQGKGITFNPLPEGC